MDLIVFDLDGTLLNQASQISPFTKETLFLLKKNNIAFTIATGRSFLSARLVIDENDFDLPQIYNNGVTMWNPKTQQFILENLLPNIEVSSILEIVNLQGITPFINVISHNNKHSIFHSEPQHEIEKELLLKFSFSTTAQLCPLDDLGPDNQVTNISMIGYKKPVNEIWLNLNENKNLIAYTGPALEGSKYSWLDVHHKKANKGSAILDLKNRLNADNIICFGDGDNDLSMFEVCDESYAPENAVPEIKNVANKIIGHNNEDGIAHFLRKRFSL